LIKSEKQLGVKLSKLKGFEVPEARLEQYITPSEIAAKVLWYAYMNKDIEYHTVADLGCGTGVLGIGCLLLNCDKVSFVDISSEALEVAKDNYKGLENGEFLNLDVHEFKEKVETVVMNPPFGVQREHADREFLEKALEIGNVVYSFHKIESQSFIDAFCKDNNAEAKKIFIFEFPLKATQKFHKKKLYKVEVGVWRIQKINK
tara:strand:- start:31 stop:639 length:609 start_codon:yes stop_codon:yes gene_type:complete